MDNVSSGGGGTNRRQFGLKTVFAALFVVAVVLAYVAHLKHQVEDFERSAAPFERLGHRKVRASTDGLGVFRGRNGITRLDFRESAITDAQLLNVQSDLERLQELHALLLGRTRITDAGVTAIANLQQLRTLDLAATAVSDRGLRDLTRLRLDFLDISATRVTDVGLATLRQQPQLRTLRLYQTSVTDAAVAELQMSLPSCRIER